MNPAGLLARGWPWLLAGGLALAIGFQLWRAVPADQATAALAEGRLLVDVRGLQEWQAGHLRDSIHAPWTDPVRALEAAGVAPDQPLLVYCATGPRAALAAQRLRLAGFEDVQEVRGGIRQLAAAGLPLAPREAPGAP